MMGWSGYIPMHVLYTHIPEILFYFRTCIIDSHSLNCLFLRSYRCIGSRVCACTPRGLCLHSSWFVLALLVVCACTPRGLYSCLVSLSASGGGGGGGSVVGGKLRCSLAAQSLQRIRWVWGGN